MKKILDEPSRVLVILYPLVSDNLCLSSSFLRNYHLEYAVFHRDILKYNLSKLLILFLLQLWVLHILLSAQTRIGEGKLEVKDAATCKLQCCNF